MPKASTCTVCQSELGPAPLRFSQNGHRAAFCSFECLINFAVERIRQRREVHNQQISELRERRRRRKSVKKGA